jgi:hypothetical protein
VAIIGRWCLSSTRRTRTRVRGVIPVILGHHASAIPGAT